MKIPDCITPIVAYRAWEMKRSGLTSLNGESWVPGRPLAATCNIGSLATALVRTKHFPRHEAPQIGCSCGIYAAKSLDELRRIGYGQLGIYGEVYLWGVVVEHRYGWRAQFAYPKTLVLSPASLLLLRRCYDDQPTSCFSLFSRAFHQRQFDKEGTPSCLGTLTSYGADIFMADGEEDLIPVWTKDSSSQSTPLDRWRDADTLTSFLARVAVLTEDQERRLILRERVRDTNLARVVFSQVGLPTHATDAIVYQIKDQRPKVVIIDLTPKNPLPGIRAIELIRAAFSDVAIVAVGMRDTNNTMAALIAGADEYVDRNNPYSLAEALSRVLVGTCTRHERRTVPQGSSTPPSGLPPPPAVVVLSPRNWPRLPPRGVPAWAV